MEEIKEVEEAIRICKDRDVLKEYLEGREKEVIDIMITLFGQEYAVEAYAQDERRKGEIKTAVEIYQEVGNSIEEAIQKLIAKFGLSRRESREYVKEYWVK